MSLRSRLPLESTQPVASFGVMRLVIVASAAIGLLLFDIPHRDRMAVVTLAVALPWALAVWGTAVRRPPLALSALVAAGDLAVLAAAEIAAPESYAAIRILAMFLIAAHAHFQGEQRGVALAVAAVVVLVPIGLATSHPLEDQSLYFSELIFAVAAICSGMFVGRLRMAESAGRLRARELSRRALEAEAQVRRRVAEAIHDGPVQELVGLDIVLATLGNALATGDLGRAEDLLAEARELTRRNATALREEMINLGPYAFDELTLDTALEQCIPVWSRRYGFEVEPSLERIDLPNEICGALFGIAQEAVANAGRHADASHVWVTLRRDGQDVELRVRDDGRGFEGEQPLGVAEAGHIGLASMRERAELIDGSLAIETGARGSEIVVRAPIAGGRGQRRHDERPGIALSGR